MIKRKFSQFLVGWKSSKKNECLLVKGARQIGKTFTITDFGKNYYKSFVYINFLETPDLKQIFGGNIDSNTILQKMSLSMPDVKIIKNDTLIFLDEIQECPSARTALKFLAMNSDIDVIASGSLLGLSYKDIESIPVGYERQVEMHSLDFEEFLWAVGIDENVVNILKEYFDKNEKIPDSIHNVMMERLRKYMIIGGMPEVVNSFLETSNFNEVQAEQEKLLKVYLDDISKFASLPEKPKVRECFLSIPRQLAKENKKFKYSEVLKGGTTRKFGNSIEWLLGANLITKCVNLSLPEFPLAAYERPDYFKIYMNDIGLLCAMYGFETKRLLFENKLSGHAKGGIYENLVADILIKKGVKLRYFKPDENNQEIEFFIEKDGGAMPIEVKSKNGATPSMNQILALKNINLGYKFTSGNIGIDGKKITLPLYMAMFL